MTTRSTSGFAAGLALACCLAITRGGHAADVSVEAPSRVWVGIPFDVNVTIDKATSYEEPRRFDAPGLRIVNDLPATRSSFTSIFNGRVSKRETVSLGFRVVAEREGALTIPAIRIVADGQVLHTRPVTVIAKRSITGDRLLLDVKSDREVYFLGERVDVTLEIWIRPYIVPSPHNVRFDEQETWGLVDQRTSSLGVFGQGNRRISYREVKRLGDDGRERSYYVYQLDASLVPGQAGDISFDDVRVVVGYPQQVRRSRGLLSTRSRWEVIAKRPLVATPGRPALRIEPTPAEGRPDVFAGAVGRFAIVATALPRDAAVGDPITLNLTVLDRGRGDAPMDLLRPPPIEGVPALVEQFRIPDDPMAGEVNGSRKTFTQTIRARNERVTEVPAIPFAFFDPESQRYETVWSDPIPLVIRAAPTITLDDLVGVEGLAGARATELTEVAGGLVANYSGAELLASERPMVLSWVHAAFLALPPVTFVGVAAARRRALVLGDRAVTRRRSAGRAALRRLRAANGPDPAQVAEEAAAAVCNYVADRLDLPPGALTRSEIVERLGAAGVNDGLLDEVSSLLSECEQAKYAGAAGEGNAVAERARGCIERLEAKKGIS